jgi:hypothetical protein
MKKYILGFFAVVLALGMSAFQQSKVSSSKLETALYWYPVNQSTNAIDHTALINPSSKLTKSQLRTNGQIPCPEAPGVDCIRGFSSLQSSDVTTQGVDFTQTDMQ